MNDSGIHGMNESTPFQPGAKLQHSGGSPIASPISCSTLNETHLAAHLSDLRFTPQQDAAAASTSALPTPAEFFKHHQECMQRTPHKHHHFPPAKLGSPERNGLIIGRKPTALKSFSSTPKSLRSSPAKKVLFPVQCKDPVVHFRRERDTRNILECIFDHLPDETLYQCRKVSKLWRAAINEVARLRRRVDAYEAQLQMAKENPRQLRQLLGVQSPQTASVACMEESRGSKFFMDVASTLSREQSLRKCPHCEQPQIVEHSIAQCQSFGCGYICCVRCGSNAWRPQDFVDACQSGALAVQRSTPLQDSPPHTQQLSLSHSYNNSHLYANSKDSCYESCSGELTGSPLDGSARRNLSSSLGNSSFAAEGKVRRSLGDVNRQEATSGMVSRRSSHHIARLYTPVLPMAGRKSPERTAADSPQKEYSAGSKASKRSLRRLAKLS